MLASVLSPDIVSAVRKPLVPPCPGDMTHVIGEPEYAIYKVIGYKGKTAVLEDAWSIVYFHQSLLVKVHAGQPIAADFGVV